MQRALLTLLLAVFGATQALALSGQEIMQKVHDQSRLHENQRSDVEMLIYRGNGSKEVRKRWFTSRFKLFEDRSKSLIRLYKPASQKGIGLLSETADNKSRSDQWIYLPAFRTVRKINSQSRNDSFLGSDLTIADMAGRKPDQDNHRVLSEDNNYWTVESVPKESDDQYSRFVSRVHKQSLVAIEVQFFDRKKRLLKTLVNQKIGKFDGMYMPTATTVNNEQSGGRTELTRSKINVKKRIGANEVGLRGLRSGK